MNTTEYLEQFLNRLNGAWGNRDYDLVARIGSTHGVFLMSEDIGRVPNDQLGFTPNLFILKGGGLTAVVETPGLKGEHIQPTIEGIIFFMSFNRKVFCLSCPHPFLEKKTTRRLWLRSDESFWLPINSFQNRFFPLAPR